MKPLDLAGLLPHGAREIVNVDHEPKYFPYKVPLFLSRSEFPH